MIEVYTNSIDYYYCTVVHTSTTKVLHTNTIIIVYTDSIEYDNCTV